jgi:hypothetical protein
MIQQKHPFVIEIESVRRMFRAKPSMNAIVVQLLVDFPFGRSEKKKKIPNHQGGKTLLIDRYVCHFRQPDSAMPPAPRGSLLTIFAGADRWFADRRLHVHAYLLKDR